MTDRDRIATALLALRAGVFIVMLMWTLDKFVNVSHAARVFEGFYGIAGLGQGVMAAIGIAELLLIVAFVVGYRSGFRTVASCSCTVSRRCPRIGSISTRSTTSCSSPPGPCWRPASRCTCCAISTRGGP